MYPKAGGDYTERINYKKTHNEPNVEVSDTTGAQE